MEDIEFGFMREASEPFDFKNPPFDPTTFAHELIKTVHERNAISLAAPQLQIPFRIFAMRGYPENYVCFNPKIVTVSEETAELEESSLSCPGFIINVKRPKSIKVRFATPNSDVRTMTFEGLSAKTFMHNMDFLDGKRFWHSCSKLYFDMNRRKCKYTKQLTYK